MYQVATDTQRESGAKAFRPMASVCEDSHSEAEDNKDKVAAFQNRRSNRFQNRPKRQNLGGLSAAIILTLALEATQTGMANTVSSARSRIIPKRSARKESERINSVETNKDVLTGQKCM
jgi:hypothetical protein